MPKQLGTNGAPALASAPAVGVAGAIYYNTTSNTLFTSDGASWAAVGGSSGGPTISDTPPSPGTAGQLWFESDTGRIYVYYDSYWVEIGSASTAAVGQLDGGLPTSTYGGVPAIDAGGV